jgi:hypothetical protein
MKSRESLGHRPDARGLQSAEDRQAPAERLSFVGKYAVHQKDLIASRMELQNQTKPIRP